MLLDRHFMLLFNFHVLKKFFLFKRKQEQGNYIGDLYYTIYAARINIWNYILKMKVFINSRWFLIRVGQKDE